MARGTHERCLITSSAGELTGGGYDDAHEDSGGNGFQRGLRRSSGLQRANWPRASMPRWLCCTWREQIVTTTFGGENYVGPAPDLQAEVEKFPRPPRAAPGPQSWRLAATDTGRHHVRFAGVCHHRLCGEHGVDLIVMGTHARGALAHLMMRSVAEKVVRLAPCPVLTVRHPEHEFIRPAHWLSWHTRRGACDIPPLLSSVSARRAHPGRAAESADRRPGTSRHPGGNGHRFTRRRTRSRRQRCAPGHASLSASCRPVRHSVWV